MMQIQLSEQQLLELGESVPAVKRAGIYLAELLSRREDLEKVIAEVGEAFQDIVASAVAMQLLKAPCAKRRKRS